MTTAAAAEQGNPFRLASRPVLACTVAVSASLYFLYGLSVYAFSLRLDVSQTNVLELLIILSQIARIVGVVAIYGFRPARLEFLLVLLSVETFVVMGLILTYLLFPSALLSSLAHIIFSTWMAAIFTVLPSYLILSGAFELARYKSLVSTLLTVLLEFTFLTFSVSTLLGFKGSFSFGNFFDFLILAFRNDMAQGVFPQLSPTFLALPSLAIYCSLLVYASLPGAMGRAVPRVAILLPLLATAAALGWVSLTIATLPNTLLSFTAPGILIVVALWAFTRE